MIYNESVDSWFYGKTIYYTACALGSGADRDHMNYFFYHLERVVPNITWSCVVRGKTVINSVPLAQVCKLYDGIHRETHENKTFAVILL